MAVNGLAENEQLVKRKKRGKFEPLTPRPQYANEIQAEWKMRGQIYKRA